MVLGFGFGIVVSVLAWVVIPASVLLTVASLAIAIAMVRKPSSVRLGFDLARLVLTVVGLVVMAAVVGVSVDPLWIVLAIAAGIALGVLQGRSLRVEWRGAQPLVVRKVDGLVFWSTGVVVMQVAGLLARGGILRVGQVVGWFGAGVLAGMIAGRQGVVTASRATASTVLLLAVGGGWVALTLGAATTSWAADSPGEWVLVNTETNPAAAEFPIQWHVDLSSTSIRVVQGFGPDDTSGAEAEFTASWPAPPATLEPGSELAIPVEVSGQITGSRDTQFFWGLNVFLRSNGERIRPGINAEVSCVETTVISNEYVCSEPEQPSRGQLETLVANSGDTWTYSISTLNCGACEVRYTYEYVGEAAITQSDTTDIGEGDSSTAAPAEADLGPTTGEAIGPEDAIAQAIAGLIVAAAIGLISLNEAGLAFGGFDVAEVIRQLRDPEQRKQSTVTERIAELLGENPASPAEADQESPPEPIPEETPSAEATDTSQEQPEHGEPGTQAISGAPRSHGELMESVREKLNAKPADRNRTLTIDEYVAYVEEIETRFPEADPQDVFRALHADEFGADLGANMPVPWTWERFQGGEEGSYYREILPALSLQPKAAEPPITYATPKWLIGPNGARIDMTHAYAGVRSDMNREGQPEFWRNFMRWTQTDGGDSWQEVMHAPGSSYEHGEVRWASEFAPPDQRAGNAMGNWLAEFYSQPENRDVPASRAIRTFFEQASRNA